MAKPGITFKAAAIRSGFPVEVLESLASQGYFETRKLAFETLIELDSFDTYLANKEKPKTKNGETNMIVGKPKLELRELIAPPNIKEVKKIDTDKNPLFGKICKDMMINKSELYVDYTYQRIRTPTGLIKLIATNFNWNLFGKLTVADMGDNYPRGKYAIVDGGGRHLAALMRDDISKLPCVVTPVNSVEEAAMLFYKLNTLRKNPTTVEKHISALAFNDPTSMSVQSIIDKYGLETAKTQKPGGIMAIRKCMEQYQGDPESFEKTIEILSQMCDDCPVYQDLIQGINYMVRFCDLGSDARYRALRGRIIKVGARQLHIKAMELATLNLKGDRMIAEGMLLLINKALHEDRRFELLPAKNNGAKKFKNWNKES